MDLVPATEDGPVQPAVARLQSSSRVQRLRAVWQLQDAGPPAVDLLCRLLRDKEPEVVIAAARALGAVGDQRAVEPLTQVPARSCEGARGCFTAGAA